jgi:hypothetical protein
MHRSLRPIGLIATPALLVALVASLAPGAARADDDDDADLLYSRPGGYAMLHVMGGVDVDRRNDQTNLAGGAGYQVRVGARETEQLAWEIEFEHFMSEGTDDHAFAYGVNGKFYFMEEVLQPYLVLGAGGYTRLREGESRKTDWGFRMGAGLDLYFTKRLALNMEHTYVAGVGDLLRQEYGSFALGLLYRF